MKHFLYILIFFKNFVINICSLVTDGKTEGLREPDSFSVSIENWGKVNWVSRPNTTGDSDSESGSCHEKSETIVISHTLNV